MREISLCLLSIGFLFFINMLCHMSSTNYFNMYQFKCCWWSYQLMSNSLSLIVSVWYLSLEGTTCSWRWHSSVQCGGHLQGAPPEQQQPIPEECWHHDSWIQQIYINKWKRASRTTSSWSKSCCPRWNWWPEEEKWRSLGKDGEDTAGSGPHQANVGQQC